VLVRSSQRERSLRGARRHRFTDGVKRTSTPLRRCSIPDVGSQAQQCEAAPRHPPRPRPRGPPTTSVCGWVRNGACKSGKRTSVRSQVYRVSSPRETREATEGSRKGNQAQEEPGLVALSKARQGCELSQGATPRSRKNGRVVTVVVTRRGSAVARFFEGYEQHRGNG